MNFMSYNIVLSTNENVEILFKTRPKISDRKQWGCLNTQVVAKWSVTYVINTL